jgi:hypothetical protein
VGQRQGGGEGGDILLALAEQHRDDVGRRVRTVFLGELQPTGHAQQLIQRDGPARIAGRAPLGRVGRSMDVDQAVADQQAGQGVGHALGLGPAGEGVLRRQALAVPFVDDAALPHDQDRVRSAQAGHGVGREGAVEVRGGGAVEALALGPGGRGPGCAGGLFGEGDQGHGPMFPRDGPVVTSRRLIFAPKGGMRNAMVRRLSIAVGLFAWPSPRRR